MNVALGERSLDVRLSEKARARLAHEPGPLDIEMELYFSCLLRKRVHFLQSPHADVAARTALNERVSVSFRPVMTHVCRASEVVNVPEVEAIPLVRPAAFTPKWLTLDFEHERWSGEFGY